MFSNYFFFKKKFFTSLEFIGAEVRFGQVGDFKGKNGGTSL